jgi:hypothetical protein
MKHELKIWPQFYCRVADGSKTFELRENDRSFQSGDTVILKEWDPTPINSTSRNPRGYTKSPPLEFTIGYIHVLNSTQVVFSLLSPFDMSFGIKPPKKKKS